MKPISNDLRDALAWFVKNKRRIAWHHQGDDIMVRPDGVFVMTGTPRKLNKGKPDRSSN